MFTTCQIFRYVNKRVTNAQCSLHLLDRSTPYQDQVTTPLFPSTPLSSQSNVSLRHRSNVQDGAGTSSPFLLPQSPVATSGNSQIIVMLQQQQSVLQNVLDSQKYGRAAEGYGGTIGRYTK